MVRARRGSVVIAMAMLIAGLVAPSAAEAKPLHFIGSVTAIDGKARTITVRNGKETRVFSTDGLNLPKLRKGDQVSVDYRLVAWKVKRR